MKRVGILIGVLLVLMTYPAWTEAGTGIATTDHDFTTGYSASPAVGLCTLCHTPHKAQTTALLWNHTYATGPWKWTDTTTTMAGTPLPTINNTWGGPTPKCLSCHDGSVAIGSISWFNETGPTTISLTKAGVLDPGTGQLIESSHIVGGSGSMNGNHPVVVPYPVGGANTYNGNKSGGALVAAEFVSDPTVNSIVLYQDLGSSMVKRVTTGASGSTNGIECSSCHDPHNGATATGEMFLRGDLTGSGSSYICNKCHIK